MNSELLKTKSLLPPNASSFEKTLENATKFNVNVSLLKGFKFKDNAQILSYLIWEYNLNDVLQYIQNSGDIIANGLVFQRARGTKAAVKVAVHWANLDDMEIDEEEPSYHFCEFQIGVKDRQFDFDIELLKNVISLAKPVRSKLSRVYNDIYDVRYFKLDNSQFGDILSDNSGVKLNDLTLSFGRNNESSIAYSGDENCLGITRIHEITSVADRIFRLDFAILDETEPDINAIGIEYQKQRIYRTKSPLCDTDFDIDRYLTFTKASIVLSEDSILDNTNSCFNPLEIIEQNATFILGINVLSEHSWSFIQRPILERFDNESASYSDVSDINPICTKPILNRDFSKNILFDSTVVLESSRNIYIDIPYYEINPYWHEHRHRNQKWCDDVYVCKILE